MRNIKLIMSYDGSRYQGWQRLPRQAQTIQGKLEDTLRRILDEEITVSGSGRTDAGAHALRQVVNFHCHSDMPCSEILSLLRRYLPEDMGIHSCQEASPRFHARLNARAKTYEYRIWNSPEPRVFRRRYEYQVPQPLDLQAMRQASEALLGTHEYRAFCTQSGAKKDTKRTISRIEWTQNGPELHMQITGTGFLYNMVRIIVGTLIEVGRHERTPDCIGAILASQDRGQAGYTVPAKGLFLVEVEY